MSETSLTNQLAALIVESSDDAILGMTLDGVIVSWNPAAKRMFGHTVEEAVGRPLEVLFPAGREREAAELLARVKAGERARVETALARKDGGTVEVSLAVSPVAAGGRTTGASAIARDISDRRALEKRLRDGQVLESLGLLAGGIAHDFNNLLTVVMGNASIVKAMVGQDSKMWEYLEDIEITAQRAADLATQMLAYSGRGVFVLQRVDLNGLVHEMTELLRVSLPKSVTLKYDLAAMLPKVEADVTQLRQVVMNLVINAAQAIGEKAGTVTVGTRLARAEREWLAGAAHAAEMPEGDYVFLTVSDTGCGMDEKTRARIFDPFFTTKKTGRGLGLSAVLGIVRGHRGAIRVDSEAGKGTAFTVIFPAGGSLVPRVRGQAGAPMEIWRGSGTVLVVDDEAKLREFAKNALELLGFRVLLASDGDEGVETMRRHAGEIGCVLLDLTMPRMSGDKALPEIRKIKPGVKVILISGYNEQEAVKDFDGGGVDAFVKKPFTVDVLRVVLRKVVG
ncbi:MAG: PAS domain S-box protein [Planctomycetes bacterium]|nr:PAS domain S-box protein [Planctomycetota bacterium]